jgi:hypothetical protein
VIRLARKDASPRPTIRTLSALSRFDDVSPELVIELTDDGYIVLGDEAAVALAEARDAILTGLPDDGLTMEGIVSDLVGKRTTAQEATRLLIASGAVNRTGAGKRGDPFRYVRNSFLPDLRKGPAAESNSGGFDGAPRSLNLTVPFPDVLPGTRA